MKEKMLSAVLLAACLCGGAAEEAVSLNQAKNWKPMGAVPVEIGRDDAEQAIRFSAARGEAKRCVIWPLFALPEKETLKGTTAIRFEMKYQPEGGNWAPAGMIVLPKRSNGSGGAIPFRVPAAGEWKTIQVKFDRTPEEMAAVHNIQILVDSPADRLTVLVRNFALLTTDEKEPELPAPSKKSPDPKEEARHKLRPVGTPISFSAEPGKKHVYRFQTTQLADGSSHAWEISGLDGGKIGLSGNATVEKGELSVELTLPAGYYEIHFPALKQTFSLSVLPPNTGKPDSFFAIEGLLEMRDPDVYDSCLAFLARHGILHNREWADFAAIHFQEGAYDDQNAPFFSAAGKKGVRSVFVFNDFPLWTDAITDHWGRKSLPWKLVGLDSAIEKMLDNRKAGVEGFHILNEYDGATNFPAEACLPPLKTAAWSVRDRGEITLLGAAFCKGSTLSERESISGGMLDFIDVFCIHNYTEPERLISYVQQYRNDMKDHPKGQMPIWITETGKAWSRGLKEAPKQAYGNTINNLRPRLEEDMTSALWITMKAVEAKACGISRYYPFAMFFFQENNNNFGMLDYYRTPLRSIHSYAFAANLLSNQEYQGDWKHNPAGLHPTRVFSDGTQAVAVFYAGRDGTGKHTVSIDGFPSGKGYAIDGSELKPEANQLTFDGGMACWVFPAEQLTPESLNTDTESMRMLKAAGSYQPVARRYTPLIYRFDFRKSGDKYTSAGYYLPEDGQLHFSITNLSDQPVVTRPRLTVPQGTTVSQQPPESLELPPRSETHFTVGITSLGQYRDTIKLGDAEDELSATTVPLFDNSQLKPETHDFMNPARWQKNSNGEQTFRFNSEEQAIEVHTDFSNKQKPEATNWSFPQYSFKPEEKKGKLVAVSFDFRYENRNAEKSPLFPMLMLSYVDKMYESYPIKDPRKEWKHYMIPVREGDNGRHYDLLRIGMGSADDDLRFFFRNVQLWYE